MGENYKFFSIFSAAVAAALLLVTLLLAGWLDEPERWTAGGTIALAVVSGVALRSLRELKRDRHINILIELGQRWDGNDLRRARERAIELGDSEIARLATLANAPTRDPAARKQHVLLLRVPNYFEDLAVIVAESAMDLEVVGRLFKALVVDEWAFWKPAIDAWREQDSFLYTQFEWLVEEMRKLPDE